MRRAHFVFFAALSMLVLVLVLGGGCAGTRAYIEWRPGLSAVDFDGTFEIALDEYEAFADQAEPNTLLDRYHGVAMPGADEALVAIGRRAAAAPAGQSRGFAVLELGGDGGVRLQDDGGRELDGTVDWLAAGPDRANAALLSGTRLTVVVQSGASAGIDAGSLLGADALGNYALMLLIDEGELTVFALPTIGGVVTAYETGFLFSFRHQPQSREPWDITVARISVTM